MAKHSVITSDEEISLAVDQTIMTHEESRAEDVHLTQLDGEALIVLKMADGSRHYIPKSQLEGLSAITDEIASEVVISQDGYGLRWPAIDLDLYVPYLLQGIYGTQKWMASIGRRGGKVRSQAKCKAARENGRRGGRPRKVATAHSQTPKHSLIHGMASNQSRPEHLDLRSRYFRHSRADFAVLFSVEEQASGSALPRLT